MHGTRAPPVGDLLTEADRQIADTLNQCQSKIRAIRQASGDSIPDFLHAEAATSTNKQKRRVRLRRLRSQAEEFRRARKVQRVVLALCALQAASTIALAVLAVRIVLFFLVGTVFGFAACFSRVQRHDALCMVLNLAYLVSSLGATFVQIIAVTGGADEYRGLPQRIAALAVAATCGPASVAAVYVLVRPLMLYRYESVALSEELADARGERHGGELGICSPSCEASVRGDEEAVLQPVAEWMSAGEPGVPLIFLPVKPRAKQSMLGKQAKPRPKANPEKAAAALLPLPPPPSHAQPTATAVVGAAVVASAAPAQAAEAAASTAAPSEHVEDGSWTAGTLDVTSPIRIALPTPDSAVLALLAEDEDAPEDDPLESEERATSTEPTDSSARASIDVGDAAEIVDRQSSLSSTADGEAGLSRSEEASYSTSVPELVRSPSCGPVSSDVCPSATEPPSLAEPSDTPSEERVSLREKVRGLSSGFKDKAIDALKQVSEAPQQTPKELFARAKALNKEGKYKRACELIEEAYALQPKISTALSAANLRLKLGDFSKAAAAYRKVIAAADTENAPSESELEMATRKLKETEEAMRAHSVSISLLSRKGVPQSLAWHAEQLEELSEELFSESATLYSEFGVELQDGLREVIRLVRARRLLSAGLTLRQVEKTVMRACLSQRDEQEREWLTTVRAVLNGVRTRASEVQQTLKEFDEPSSLGWTSAGESMGVHTEWRAVDDGSLWVRMEGELTGASLVHAAAVAYEADLWPKWVPLCAGAEVLHAADPTERTTWLQFDLPMLKRGALLHWYMCDTLLERKAVILLGASVAEHPDAERPAASANVTLADFRAIKVLVRPRSSTSASIRWVMNVDLKASMPQAIISMVTKKIAGSMLSLLMREAVKVSRDAETPASVDANPYLRRLEQRGEFYHMISTLCSNFFDLYGEDEPEEDGDE